CNFCLIIFFFFFQAEDGIRDYKVTGVQTCALPISSPAGPARSQRSWARKESDNRLQRVRCAARRDCRFVPLSGPSRQNASTVRQIGRASCRERVEIAVVAGGLKKRDNKVTEEDRQL